MGGGGDFGSGSGSKFNCAARVGSGQTISGTGRVRASVLSPCRPLECVSMQRNLFIMSEGACHMYSVLTIPYGCLNVQNVIPFEITLGRIFQAPLKHNSLLFFSCIFSS